ncbi:BspA family leucine-rich repeat surface protein [Cyclobacterium sediminis]
MRTVNHFFRSTLSAQQTPFISEWNTENTSSGSSPSSTIQLPLRSSGVGYNLWVDWGDGNHSRITSFDDDNATHTYSSGGVYTIKIYGKIHDFRFGNTRDRLKLLNISQWGKCSFLGTSAFYGCENLQLSASDVPDLSRYNLILVDMFRGCTAFTGSPSMNDWDVSNQTSALRCFFVCENFNASINNWDTSLFSSFVNMLNRCYAFNQDVSGLSFESAISCLGFMNNTTSFSTTNYDLFLNSLAGQSLNSNVDLTMGDVEYSASAAASRASIITNYNWTITDGGQTS